MCDLEPFSKIPSQLMPEILLYVAILWLYQDHACKNRASVPAH